MAWDESAICCNNPQYAGKGHHKTGEDYTAAPNIDHTQARTCPASVELSSSGSAQRHASDDSSDCTKLCFRMSVASCSLQLRMRFR